MNSEDRPWRERLTESASSTLPGTAGERIAFLVLLVIAAVLRLWDLPHIPYTHDEISALLRTGYGTFGQLIRDGVAVDGHPAGVQVFLHYWTKVFGYGEGVVKLPFILASIAALFFLYRFAHAWTGVSVALIITGLLAAMQYTVMYGQIARPYAMGLFTTALLADQLTRYIATGRRGALIGSVIGATLSAYTHHFALLLAGLMTLTGFAWVPAQQRRAYLIACGACILLYAPHIAILFQQLGYKGLYLWLQPPGSDWLPQYGWWIAHCSIAFAAVIVLLIAASAALRMRHPGWSGPVWAIAFVWGLTPLVIGWCYSIWRAPVLQYSVVLFSFPYVLLGLLAGLRSLRPVGGMIAAFTVVAVGTATLIQVREHYALFYRSKYEAIARGIVDAASATDRIALVDAPDNVIRFYLKKWGADSNTTYVQVHDRDAAFVDSMLQKARGKRIFFGRSGDGTPENLAIIQARSPFLVERHDMAEGQTFLFQGSPGGGRIEDTFNARLITPEAIESEGWKVDADVPHVRDTTASYMTPPQRWDFTGREYGAVFEEPVYKMVQGDNDVIEVRADVLNAAPDSRMSLVVELKDGDSTRFYRNTNMEAFRMRSDGRASLITAIKLSDMPGHGSGQRMRAYLWNPDKRAAWISALSVRVREGDPVLYGFFEDFKGPWRYR